jgi:hypothetical protein
MVLPTGKVAGAGKAEWWSFEAKRVESWRLFGRFGGLDCLTFHFLLSHVPASSGLAPAPILVSTTGFRPLRTCQRIGTVCTCPCDLRRTLPREYILARKCYSPADRYACRGGFPPPPPLLPGLRCLALT